MMPGEIEGRGRLAYYRHDTRELGAEVPTPKNLTINVKLDIRTDAGEATVKQRMRGQLAWLMTEGMELPVLLDPETRLASSIDQDKLEAELAGGAEDIAAAHKDQARVLYDVPSRGEVTEAKEIVREAAQGVRGLFRRRRD